jgi:stalled ribosome rescue protein Dom34
MEDRIMAKTDERETAPHLLVVIDHQEAKVYRTEAHGTVPVRIVPYDPHGYRKHLHSAHEWTDGKRQPERKSFYEAIAKTLRGSERVLLFGSGTGRSSAMEMLLADLKAHHADVADKIIGSVVVDAHHTTEEQLLAKARDFYAEFNRK